MELIKHNDYSLIKMNQFSKLTSLITLLHKSTLRPFNIIIDILDINVDDKSPVLKLFPFHLIWQKRNKSFILVSNIKKRISKRDDIYQYFRRIS